MRHKPSIEPNSTHRLLKNLDLAIDEAKLVHSVIQLSDQVRNIESIPEAAKRCQYLQKEIARLECELAGVRNQATLINLPLSRSHLSKV